MNLQNLLTQMFYVLIALCVVRLLDIVVRRLYFHPLSHFPGPKLAAITFLYEFYWDVIQPGRLTWHLADLHAKYGPIVRLTPDEVHIQDSSFFEELYVKPSGRKNRLPRFSRRFGSKSMCFTTWQHDLNRRRRAAISPFFSAKKVTELQPVIRSKLARLSKRLDELSKSRESFAVNLAYMALIADITSTYAFARSYNQLDSPFFETTYDASAKAITKTGSLALHFPYIFNIMDACPLWLTRIINPDIMPFMLFYNDITREIRDISTGINKGYETSSNPTIFHELLHSPALPEHDKNEAHLIEEAVEIIAAGVSTSASALTTATYHIATNPKVLRNLQSELRQHIPHFPSDFTLSDLNDVETTKLIDWHALEPLPYLSGCVRESIRLSGGILTRNPRILEDQDLKYTAHKPSPNDPKSTATTSNTTPHSYNLPAGTPISMTSWHISNDPKIFPNPESFEPERWITTTTTTTTPTTTKKSSRNIEMDKNLVTFGKGSRQCIGINLAFAELYVSLATLFRRFEFDVTDDTSYERDVRVSHAYNVGFPDARSKGVLMRVRKIDD